jgi:uncharacterized OB-fold protein
MVVIILPEVKCVKCGHKWTPRKSDVRLCAKCKTPYWDKPSPKAKKRGRIGRNTDCKEK